MPALFAFQSHPTPQPHRVTRLLPQEGYRFLETGEDRDSLLNNERFMDPGFDRQDVDAPAPFIEADAAMGSQTKHATAARHSHHSHRCR